MTREAKIGMLTGLGVIVLIGVLLSEYLGGGPHGMGTGSMMATGRMASLPMGAAYRQEIMQPVGVPSLVRADGASVAPGAGVTTPSVSAASMAPPVAYGATDVGGAPRMDTPLAAGPAINQPVTAVPAGAVQMNVQQGSIPTMQMPVTGVQTVYVAGQAQPVTQNRGTMTADGTVTPVADAAVPSPAKPVGQEYVIAAGDNLAKIAKKFYKSSKNSDIERIVAANPAMLKNDKSTLIAGKKLLIPTVVRAVADATPAAPATAVPVPGDVVIRKPGSGDSGSHGAAGASAKKTAAKVYVVQANDTLEKIAKKLGVPVKKIVAANGIKDVNALQVGEKLQVPVA